MPKQRTYTGTKKGTSMARQGRRSKIVGGGHTTSPAASDKKEAQKQKKERPSRSFLGTLTAFAVDIIVGAVIGIAVVIGFWGSIPSPVNIILVAVLGALIACMAVLKVRQSRSTDPGYRGAPFSYKIKKFFGRV